MYDCRRRLDEFRCLLNVWATGQQDLLQLCTFFVTSLNTVWRCRPGGCRWVGTRAASLNRQILHGRDGTLLFWYSVWVQKLCSLPHLSWHRSPFFVYYWEFILDMEWTAAQYWACCVASRGASLRLLPHSHSLRRVGSDGSSRTAQGGSLVKIHGFPHADALDLNRIDDCPLAIPSNESD